MSEPMNATGFCAQFRFGDKVIIDGDGSIVASVIGFAFYPHHYTVLCGWIHNGAAVEAWVGDFRLTRRAAS